MSSSPGSTGSSREAEPTVEAYLDRLSDALSALPDGDRSEIVEETRSHIADRWGGRPEAGRAAFEELGPPEAYAAGFLENYGAGGRAGGGDDGRGRAKTALGYLSLAIALLALLWGVFQILTIPPDTPGWLTFRDVTFGPRGWLLMLVPSVLLAVGLTWAGLALTRGDTPDRRGEE